MSILVRVAGIHDLDAFGFNGITQLFGKNQGFPLAAVTLCSLTARTTRLSA